MKLSTEMVKILVIFVAFFVLDSYGRYLHHSTTTQHFPQVAVVNQRKHGLISDIKPRKKQPVGEGKFQLQLHPIKLNLWKPSSGEKLVIPYSFGDGFPFKKEVKVAIDTMNGHLKCGHDVWVPYTNHKHRVEFVQKSGCWSSLGKDYDEPNKQYISIDSGCEYKHIVLHEMMHAMGFHHEQNRIDRDKYIEIVSENIMDGLYSQFEKAEETNIYETKVGYDYLSVMHYDLRAFSKNGDKTMMLKPTKEAMAMTQQQMSIIGNVPDLSEKDIKELRMYFSCDGESNKGDKDTSTSVGIKPVVPITSSPVSTTENTFQTTNDPVTTTDESWSSTTDESSSSTTDESSSSTTDESSGDEYIDPDEGDWYPGKDIKTTQDTFTTDDKFKTTDDPVTTVSYPTDGSYGGEDGWYPEMDEDSGYEEWFPDM